LVPGARFCANCKLPVGVPPPPPPSGQTASICKQCSTPLAPNIKFCSKCGTLNPASSSPAPASSPSLTVSMSSAYGSNRRGAPPSSERPNLMGSQAPSDIRARSKSTEERNEEELKIKQDLAKKDAEQKLKQEEELKLKREADMKAKQERERKEQEKLEKEKQLHSQPQEREPIQEIQPTNEAVDYEIRWKSAESRIKDLEEQLRNVNEQLYIAEQKIVLFGSNTPSPTETPASEEESGGPPPPPPPGPPPPPSVGMPPMTSAKTDLMAAIREGKKLRKTEAPKLDKSSEAGSSGPSNLKKSPSASDGGMFSMAEMAAKMAQSKGALGKKVVIEKQKKEDKPMSELDKKLSFRNMNKEQLQEAMKTLEKQQSSNK